MTTRVFVFFFFFLLSIDSKRVVWEWEYETLLNERMQSNPRVLWPLRRAIACLLRVYYAFDLINSSLCSRFLINKHSSYYLLWQLQISLSLSLSFVIGSNNFRWEPLFVYFFVSVSVCACFIYEIEEHKSILLLSFS